MKTSETTGHGGAGGGAGGRLHWSCTVGEAPVASVYSAYLNRLEAVAIAARTGNPLLIRIAVAHLDRLGSGPVE